MGEIFERVRKALADRYEVEREIGRGGMAVVFLARDLQLGRRVAIKVVRPELSQAVGHERFLREVRIEAALDHPNIVALFDSGEADGLPYYVMPYVDGESLRERLERENRLALDEVLRITRGIAEGLSYAHERGVIHKDIKPENILLSGDRVLIADFGIAKATEEAGGETLTTYGIILGTPQYMSPEQAVGDKVDARSDIYALGCVVYEMLGGDPPFTGKTRSAIVAKHIQERVPSLGIVRTDIPLGIVGDVERTLKKVPGDRFETATEFARALEAGSKTRPVTPGYWWRRAAIASFGITGAVVVGVAIPTPNPPRPLDRNIIIGFPLDEAGNTDLPQGIGEMVALAIGSAFEETTPLQWIDGWTKLSADQRADVSVVTSAAKVEIAKAARARYRVDGSVVATTGSSRVILWLYDVATDSLLARKTVQGVSTDTSVMRLGVSAVRELLPIVLQPGRDVERIPLEDRDFAAVALWMEGKREYRASRFAPALVFYERAVERDSALSMAALNAAQAASWLGHLDQAERLVNVALARGSDLPAPQRYFANGLHAYLTGASDNAVAWFRRAIATDDDWTEAHMALGEVYYHLLPSSSAQLDSLARAEFVAAASDSLFSLPLYHLAEMAIRLGDVANGSELLNQYREFEPDSTILQLLSIMLECVVGGADNMDWDAAVRSDAPGALSAAKSLSVGGWQPACAEGGFRAVMRDATADSLHWGSVQGLQGVLLALGRHSDYESLIDSVIGYRPQTMTLYTLAAIVDTHFTSRAAETEAFVKQAFGGEYEDSPTAQLRWIMGVWHANKGDTDLVRSLRDDLLELDDDREAELYASGLTAQLALLEGDSAKAISLLGQLHSTGTRREVEWRVGETLPVERLLLAQVLFQRDRYDEAIEVASGFDHPAPIMYPGFLAPSLLLRYRTAEAVGDDPLAARFAERLQRLGRGRLAGVEQH